VSRRNVDKETIASEEFVAVKSNGLVGYFGENKPSVDSPIQIKVFENYPNINYIIHGHVYIAGGLTTQNKIPCGYVDEYSDINELYPDKTVKKMLINLKGHGCFIAANSLDDFREIKFLSRILWEKD
jgi:ribulose-5-phosphate 4-epimerase/fuculose-1-phosphate aldolase